LTVLHPPPALFFDPLLENFAAISHVSPDQFQTSTHEAGSSQKEEGFIMVPDICRVDDNAYQETRRIHQNLAFSPVYLLRPVVTVDPPFSVVFTDWESMIAADGSASRSIRLRTSSWRWS
jgi:hypothetical protein